MSLAMQPNLWVTSTLRDVLTRSDERIDPLVNINTEVYIGLEHIESDTGRLLNIPAPPSEELKSIKSVFHPGDILYGKLRPYLNKVYLTEERGICSTDLWVFRVTSVIDPAYASYYLRSSMVSQQVSQLAVGANLPRISDTAFDRITIPLPPLPEQRRIAIILREADEIRKLRRRANEKAQEIVSALFYDMFGDPDRNERNWRTARIRDLCNLVRGSSPRPQGDPRYFGGPIPRLMVADITRDGSYVTPRIDSLTEEGAKSSRLMKAGSVVMAVSGDPGLSAILSVDACIHDGFVGFRDLSEQLLPEFFLQHLQALKERSSAQAVGATFQNLTTDQINSWLVLLPPLELQMQYATICAEINFVGEQNNNTFQHLDTLHQSLLARAFTGDLTATWREQHTEDLAQAARERDRLLAQLRLAPAELVTPAQPTRSEISERQELLAMLNDVQRALLAMLDEQLATYYTANSAHEELVTIECSLDVVRRELHFLAAAGWIKEQSLPAEGEAGVRYIPVYRFLLPDDDSQQPDIDQLIARLGPEYPDEVLV